MFIPKLYNPIIVNPKTLPKPLHVASTAQTTLQLRQLEARREQPPPPAAEEMGVELGEYSMVVSSNGVPQSGSFTMVYFMENPNLKWMMPRGMAYDTY